MVFLQEYIFSYVWFSVAVETLLYKVYWVVHDTITFFSLGEKIKHAVVNIRGANGIEGKLFIEEVELFSIIQGRITGLPEGQHGFHIHQYGDLSNVCKSTGGHYNPHQKTHGAPGDKARHVGDLGNIVAGRTGIANVDIFDTQVRLNGPTSVIGRAFVIHKKTDDLGRGGDEGSLATGNAGSRLACGTIGIAKNKRTR